MGTCHRASVKNRSLISFGCSALGLVIWLAVSEEGFASQQDASPVSKAPEEIARLLAEQGKVATLSAPKRVVKQAIEKSDKSYDLPFGKSKAVLVELPAFETPYALRIISLCNCSGPSKSLFVPTIIFMDAEFRKTFELDEKQFAFAAKRVIMRTIDVDSVSASIDVDGERRADRYLLIYTRGDLAGQLLGMEKASWPLFGRSSVPYLRGSYGTLVLVTSPPKQ